MAFCHLHFRLLLKLMASKISKNPFGHILKANNGCSFLIQLPG